MGYTALIEIFLDQLVDSAQIWPCQYFYNLYSTHAQISRPMIATPQAILAGGCDTCRISAAAQFFCVVPTNGTAQPMAPTGFTMGTLRLGSPWALWSCAVVNGADILTRPLNLQYPICRFTEICPFSTCPDMTFWAGTGELRDG